MTSLWLNHGQNRAAAAAAGADTASIPNAEVVVVGAGLTGLVTAVLLARGGKRVAVVEARTPGACTTGNTTAKISLLQGTRLSAISRRQPVDLVRRYVDGNREGQAWLLQYCAERGVDVQREDAITYAQADRGLPACRAELHAAKSAGLDVEWINDLADYPDVPVPFRGGVRLSGQAQFDPVPLLATLIAELRERGGRLVTGRRVQSISTGTGRIQLTLRDNDGDRDGEEQVTEADQCVLATGTPILDRGGFFARLEPSRSYCVSFALPEPAPRPMMLSADPPTRSLRYAKVGGSEQLIVGGGSHVVGRKANPRSSYDELIAWTQRHFPGSHPTNCWSAQDYLPIDELPFVGPLLPGSDRIFVATGFAKWGMTNGVAAALLLTKRILGGEPGSWATAFESWSPHELTGLPTAVRLNLEVGWQLATGWAAASVHRDGKPPQGGGRVSGPPWQMTARSNVDGVDRKVSPVCTHLGGILNWNDAENSWDCPLHGSRFCPDGTVLEGPATRNLCGGEAGSFKPRSSG